MVQRPIPDVVVGVVDPAERLLEESGRRGPFDDVELLILYVDGGHRARSVAIRQMQLVPADAVVGVPVQLRYLRIALEELPRRMHDCAVKIEAPVSHT
jgi:hypothetical protein